MSSFKGIAFKVESDGNWFPLVEDGGGDDPPKLTVKAVFMSRVIMRQMMDLVTRGTARRVRGTRVWDYSVDQGVQPGSLIIAEYGGHQVTHSTATLVSMGNVKGYGKEAIQQFRADLEFWILSDVTP